MSNQSVKEKSNVFFKHVQWLFIFLSSITLSLSAQESAENLMDKMAATFDKNTGYTIGFTMNIKQLLQRTTESFDAKMVLKGDQFYLVTPDMEAWYNGTTQWILIYMNDEVNISNPTKEEAEQINPVQILNSYKKGYTCTYKGERNDVKGRPSHVVELIPEKPDNIEYITLLINKSNYFPNSILIHQKGSIETVIHINTIRKEANSPDAMFIFDKKKYPDVEIIDLR